MTINTPAGPIVVADSIRDLSAHRYLLFNQAWVREAGEGCDFYGTESHLSRLGLFLGKKDHESAANEYTNMILQLRNLSSNTPQHLLVNTLAPLVVTIAGVAYDVVTADGLQQTANAILATGITQEALEQAVTDSKKNFNRT